MKRACELAVVLAVLGTSCAVLTVDVDVYKGPLSNHEDVQVEQLAAMAIGARPLLIQLRDQLTHDKSKQGLHYIRDMAASDDRRAIVVNAILGLYLDRQETLSSVPLLPSLLEECRQLLQRSRELAQRLEENDQLADFATSLYRGVLAAPTSKNGVFEQLEVPTNAAAVAMVIAAAMWNGADVTGIAVGIQDYARGFRELREHINAGLVKMLDIIEEIDGRADLARKADALDAAASLAAGLVQGRILVAALSTPGILASEETDFLRRELRWEPALSGLDKDAWLEPDYDSIAVRIRALLVQQPTTTSRALKAVHRGVTNLTAPASPSLSRAEQTDPKALKYGIARGPSFDDEDTADFNRWLRRLEALEAAMTPDYGLTEGRPEKGIAPLVDEYIRKRSDDPQHKIDQELTDALVHLAQKILFIVNNDAFIGRRIKAPDAKAAARADSEAESETLTNDNYIRILQAVGNSILTLTDEIRHRETFEGDDAEHGAARAARELRAARSVWDSTPAETLEDLVHVLATTKRFPDELVSSLEDAVETARTAQEEEKRRCDARAFREGLAGSTLDTWKRATVPAAETTTRARIESLSTALDAADQSDDTIKKAKEALTAHRNAVMEEASTDRASALDALERTRRASLKLDAAVDLSPTCHLEAETRTFDAAKSALEDMQAHLRKIATSKVDELKGAVLAEAGKLPARPSRGDTIDMLLDALRKKAGGPPIDDDAKNAAAIVLENSYTFMVDLTPGEATRATDTIDQLLATLRHMHVDRVLKSGTDDPDAKHIAEAIDLASVYRSSTIFIRPPSAYLRSSYPTTSLQDNDVGWKNELSDLFGRSLSSGRLPPEQQQLLDVRSEIDRQFWQNINRIRVSGFGKTNYVLAKDDIGNWYVKGYDSDPESVIRGAQSIALAGMSGGLGTDTFDRLRAVKKTREQGAKYEPGSYPTVLGRHVDRFAGRYQESTEKDSKDLRTAAADVDAALKEAWTAQSEWTAEVQLDPAANKEPVLRPEHRGDLESAVDAAATKFLTPKDLPKDPNPDDYTKDCITTIGALLDFEESVLAKIAPKTLAPADQVEAAKTSLQGAQTRLAAMDGDVKLKRALADAAEKSAKAATERQRETAKALEVARAGADQAAVARAAAADEEAKHCAEEAGKANDLAAAALSEASGKLDSAKTEVEQLAADLARKQQLLTRRQALVAALRRDVDEVVGKKVRAFLERRSDAVTDYETALDVLGQKPEPEAGAPTPTPTPAPPPAPTNG